MSTARDFDFLHGEWNVRHRRLLTRFADTQQWQEFGGETRVWPTLDGQGNVDDNRIEIPSGTYSAMSIRTFNEQTKLWAIWWLDARNPHSIDVPVLGSFNDGQGVFLAEDVIDGRSVKVQFLLAGYAHANTKMGTSVLSRWWSELGNELDHGIRAKMSASDIAISSTTITVGGRCSQIGMAIKSPLAFRAFNSTSPNRARAAPSAAHKAQVPRGVHWAKTTPQPCSWLALFPSTRGKRG